MKKHFYHPELLQTPEGVRDIYGAECEVKNFITDTIHKGLLSHGFHDIQTPSFEYFDIFNKERGTVKANEMYKFFDRNNNTLVLRPDITPSIARSVAKYYEDETLQVRLCYVGNTFVSNNSYQGKLTEITQAGAELINDDTSDADAEMIAITVESLLKTGLKEFQVDVGHVDFFNGLADEAGLDELEKDELRELLDKKNTFAVENYLSDKEMDDDIKQLLIKLPEMFGNDEYISYAKENVSNEVSLNALKRLEKLGKILDIYGLRQYVNYDLGMLSSFRYYTGIIFKAYTYGTGEPVAAGGRYDRLLAQFGKEGNAIGVAINIDQLMLALQRQKIDTYCSHSSCIVIYESDDIKKALSVATEKRDEGIYVQMIRKDSAVSDDEYREYAKRHNISEIIFI